MMRLIGYLVLASIMIFATTQVTAYTMCPDGSYVSGDRCQMTPDGGYVGGDGYEMTPDGGYVGKHRERTWDKLDNWDRY